MNMASPETCMSVAPWDKTDAYQYFLNQDIENLKYVSMGDSFEIFDLRFDILSAYGAHVEQLSHDYLNDGSMMFKVTHEEESMLFYADVGVNSSDYLLNYWGDFLKSDYLQMGHHGYGGLQDSFYQQVAPKAAFFDAPESMMLDTTGKYDNPENMALMKSLGADIYYFGKEPQAIVLK